MDTPACYNMRAPPLTEAERPLRTNRPPYGWFAFDIIMAVNRKPEATQSSRNFKQGVARSNRMLARLRWVMQEMDPEGEPALCMPDALATLVLTTVHELVGVVLEFLEDLRSPSEEGEAEKRVANESPLLLASTRMVRPVS